jgi:hypothetical protein
MEKKMDQRGDTMERKKNEGERRPTWAKNKGCKEWRNKPKGSGKVGGRGDLLIDDVKESRKDFSTLGLSFLETEGSAGKKNWDAVSLAIFSFLDTSRFGIRILFDLVALMAGVVVNVIDRDLVF